MKLAVNVTGTLAEQFGLWTLAWAILLDGLVGVVTLGFYYPGRGLRSARNLCAWRTRRAAILTGDKA